MAQSKRDKLLDQYEREIRTAMARTLWAIAYIEWYETLTHDEREDLRIPRLPPGGHVEAWAPTTPQGAHQAARDLAELFGKAENIGRRRPLTTLYEHAIHADTGQPPEFDEIFGRALSDTQVAAATLLLEFGSDLAMMALQSGVSWFDDHKEFELEVPRFSVTYDGTDFLWEGTLEKFTPGSKRVGMAYAEYSFRAVQFKFDGFQRVLAALKIRNKKAEIVRVPPYTRARYSGYPAWRWGNDKIELVTAWNPITGQSAGRERTNTRADYAGGIGIRGDRSKVMYAVDLIREHATRNDTDGAQIWSPEFDGRDGDYYMRFPVGAAPLRKNANLISSKECSTVYHSTLKADAAKWAQLEKKGEQHTEADETGPAETLELRDCDRCPSTLAKVVTTYAPNPVPPRLQVAKQAAKRAEAGLAERRASAEFQERKCDDACPGWDVFETRHGSGVQVCDECNNIAHKLGLPVLEDSEVKHLPAAAAALRRAVSMSNRCADCGGSTAPGTPDPHVCGELDEET